MNQGRRVEREEKRRKQEGGDEEGRSLAGSGGGWMFLSNGRTATSPRGRSMNRREMGD